MSMFYIGIFKGEVKVRAHTADELVSKSSAFDSLRPHAPYICMVSNDMAACQTYTHINYEEDESNNSKYGFHGIHNKNTDN